MIEQLLKDIKEDKVDNLCTTSFKFKTDVWNFFQGYQDKVAVEFGTHKGQTTRILSFLFKKVYTININDNLASKELNSDRDNIEYIDNFDLYAGNSLPIADKIAMCLIDAGHEYAQVISDINTAFSFNCDDDCYIVFDDYGLEQYADHVHKAVNHAIDINVLTIVTGIGHEAGYNFGGNPPRILKTSEGVITKVNFV
jgi:hypothetical protein